ncbi:MAG: NUDIX hydrolase, partial [Candidatus Binatia bacterium]
MTRPPADSDLATLARERAWPVRVADAAMRFILVVAYRLLYAYWFVARPRTHGAYVLAWWQGQLLLIRHAYKPFLFVPGGSPSRGESYRDAAARELREEVGIAVEASRLQRVGQLVNGHEHKYDIVEVFEIVLEDAPEIRIDGREIVWAGFRPARELGALDLSPLTGDFVR